MVCYCYPQSSALVGKYLSTTIVNVQNLSVFVVNKKCRNKNYPQVSEQSRGMEDDEKFLYTKYGAD